MRGVPRPIVAPEIGCDFSEHRGCKERGVMIEYCPFFGEPRNRPDNVHIVGFVIELSNLLFEHRIKPIEMCIYVGPRFPIIPPKRVLLRHAIH